MINGRNFNDEASRKQLGPLEPSGSEEEPSETTLPINETDLPFEAELALGFILPRLNIGENFYYLNSRGEPKIVQIRGREDDKVLVQFMKIVQGEKEPELVPVSEQIYSINADYLEQRPRVRLPKKEPDYKTLYSRYKAIVAEPDKLPQEKPLSEERGLDQDLQELAEEEGPEEEKPAQPEEEKPAQPKEEKPTRMERSPETKGLSGPRVLGALARDAARILKVKRGNLEIEIWTPFSGPRFDTNTGQTNESWQGAVRRVPYKLAGEIINPDDTIIWTANTGERVSLKYHGLDTQGKPVLGKPEISGPEELPEPENGQGVEFSENDLPPGAENLSSGEQTSQEPTAEKQKDSTGQIESSGSLPPKRRKKRKDQQESPSRPTRRKGKGRLPKQRKNPPGKGKSRQER